MASGLLREDLQNEKFYLESISMFLRASYGMKERLEMYLGILRNVADLGDELLLKKLDIWRCDDDGRPNYFDADGPEWDATTDYYLDLIGSIFGLRRQIILTISDNQTQVTLNNYEFLLYIQAFAAKSRFDGTNKSLRKVYTGSTVFNFVQYKLSGTYDLNLIDPQYKDSYLAGLNIVYLSTGDLEATCVMIAQGGTPYGSTGGYVNAMFMNHLLTIESLGIIYTMTNARMFTDGYFGDTNDPRPATDSYFFGAGYTGNTVYRFGGN